MPYFDGTRFHVFYLVDEGHHSVGNGLGGHRWAHVSTLNLVDWQEHPLAVTPSNEATESICTGSVIEKDQRYFAFYAIRQRNWEQRIHVSVSSDGNRFSRIPGGAMIEAPPEYLPTDFRDPFVFMDTAGRYQMLVTSRLREFPLYQRGGCILRLSSDDLEQWQVEGPMFIPGGPAGEANVPECPDYFAIGDWFYLVYGPDHQTRYLKSQFEFGPWTQPDHDVLGPSWMLSVMKTAPYKHGRRIGVGWIGSRENSQDDGNMMWGGAAICREVVQRDNGDLELAFVPELTPSVSQDELSFEIQAVTPRVSVSNGTAVISADTVGGEQVAQVADVPESCQISLAIDFTEETRSFGLGLRGSGEFESFYPLVFDLARERIVLADAEIAFAMSPCRNLNAQIHLWGSVVDVMIEGVGCISNRLHNLRGGILFLFATSGVVGFRDIQIRRWRNAPNSSECKLL